MINKYKTILWDFDGVILDSMPTREMGFSQVLRKYPQEQVEKLLSFHRENGGISRYFKFRFFFEEIRKEQVSDETINHLANEFSQIMVALLLNKKLLIADTIDYIKSNWQKQQMHIVSASDEKELNYLCKNLEIADYFHSIHGSPTTKIENVENILKRVNCNKDEIVLVGDSKNDYDAAIINKISFCGYNNPSLKSLDNILYTEKFISIT